LLAITEDAAAAIKGIVGSPEQPEGAGLRLTLRTAQGANTDDGQGPRTDLWLSVVAGPEEGDEVLEAERIFLAPEAAEFLDDRVLDADIVDGEPRFNLIFKAESL
jgi:iron-sulfur cluster assembly protein